MAGTASEGTSPYKHPYHLVDPSPWPLLSAFAGGALVSGIVVMAHGGGKWLLLLGALAVAACMFGWWRDVLKESRNPAYHTPVVRLGLRYGMILFIASEVMFFVAFFWMFFDMALFHESRALTPEVGAWADTAAAWSTWPPQGVEVLSPWQLPLLNTVTLLLSGCTVTWAHHAVQVGDRAGAKLALIITVALGVLFTFVQAYEYNHILHENLFFNEEAAGSGLYGSIFFMATGFHGFHVLIGSIFLLVCLLRLYAGQMTPQKHFGFEAAAWYWHFVDVVWLFLFAFVYVVYG